MTILGNTGMLIGMVRAITPVNKRMLISGKKLCAYKQAFWLAYPFPEHADSAQPRNTRPDCLSIMHQLQVIRRGLSADCIPVSEKFSWNPARPAWRRCTRARDRFAVLTMRA